MLRFLLILCLAFVVAGPSIAQTSEDDGTYLERLIEDALSGEGRDVAITGFSGALSSQARLERMTISDADGIWLVLEDAELDWTRSALFRGALEVNSLRAARLDILRSPKPQEGIDLPAAEATPFSFPQLPVSIRIGELAIDRLTLGPTLIGQEAVLGLNGNAAIDGDQADLQLALVRIDTGGRFDVAVQYSDADQSIALSISLDEPENGLVANLIGISGQPALSLTVQGTGPINDLATDIRLRTNGEDRLAGQVTLTGTATGGTGFAADISGDVTALFAPQYRAFFGADVRLNARGSRDVNGALSLSEMALDARMVSLEGQVDLNPAGWPRRLNFRGRIADPQGAPVLLPLPGAETRIGGATFGVLFDATRGDAIDARADITGLDRPDMSSDAVSLRLDGQLSVPLDAPASLDALLALEAAGLDLSGGDLAAVIGSRTRLSTRIAIRQGETISLRDLLLTGAGYRLSGDTVVSGEGADTSVNFDLNADFSDLRLFSGVAGRRISGAAALTAKGEVTPLNGGFDVVVTGVANNLTTGEKQVDALTAGRSDLDMAVRRGPDGITVERFRLTNPAISATANGAITSRNSRLDYSLRLDDVKRLVPDYTGALAASGQVSRDADGNWSTDTALIAPYGARADVSGQLTGDNAAVSLSASIPDISPLVSDLSGPVEVAGNALRARNGWNVSVDASGAGGIVARVEGDVSENGVPQLTATGSLPLGLSEPFIKPLSLIGTASFDLALRGGTDISDLSGRIRTNGARFYDPNTGVALETISVDATLADGSAAISGRANGVSGGTLQTNGRIALDPSLNGNLSLTLNEMVFRDPRLFDARVNADLAVSGPLAGGAMIRGAVTLGETTILVQPSAFGATGSIPEITHVGEDAASRASRQRAGLIIDPAAKRSGQQASYGLDVSLSIPNRLFVRGRGLEAEMAGALAFQGTTNAVVSTGAISLVRGRLDLLGKRFDLTEGNVGFQGSLDPNLRFVATGPITGGSASIVVEGPASAPEVSFASSPQAPEDEVIAQLFFGRSLSELSAFQTLQLASAVATLAGNSGSDVVSRLRQGLNLDDFDIVTGDDGTAAVRAGKYISENIYTDFTVGQDTGEVSLNLDLNPSLTVRGSVASDGNTGLGIFFERDY